MEGEVGMEGTLERLDWTGNNHIKPSTKINVKHQIHVKPYL